VLDTSLIPLSLYVHVPWCERKCPYCDFNSHQLKEQLPEKRYIDALLADLDLDLAEHARWLEGRRLNTIFIGGGTPSLLSADAIGHLLISIRQRFACDPDLETTLEANPGSAEANKFCDYRAAGVNRLSLGVQSFNDESLQELGRIHNGANARAAIAAIRHAGFTNFNIDLMFGLPRQFLADALRDIQQAVACDPSHISHYQLTIEPNTWFHRHPPSLPDDDSIWLMQQKSGERLQDAGYEQYEVSAYSRPGQACRHNQNYWRFGDYLGIGAGAHGKITGPRNVVRTWKVKHPRQYLECATTGARVGGAEVIDSDTLILEFMLNALRLREPITVPLFTTRTGLPATTINSRLANAAATGLLDWDGRAFRATALGYRHLNALLESFVPDPKGKDQENARELRLI